MTEIKAQEKNCNNQEFQEFEERKRNIVSKRYITLALILPFLFSGLGMFSAYIITLESSLLVRRFALILGTSVGFIIAIFGLFIMHITINKRFNQLKLSFEENF